MITLTDVFRSGHKCLSCLGLYELWQSCPILIHRKGHSESKSDNAALRLNAKRLRKAISGRWSVRGDWPAAAPGAEQPTTGGAPGSGDWRSGWVDGWTGGWSTGWAVAWRAASWNARTWGNGARIWTVDKNDGETKIA